MVKIRRIVFTVFCLFSLLPIAIFGADFLGQFGMTVDNQIKDQKVYWQDKCFNLIPKKFNALLEIGKGYYSLTIQKRYSFLPQKFLFLGQGDYNCEFFRKIDSENFSTCIEPRNDITLIASNAKLDSMLEDIEYQQIDSCILKNYINEN